LAIVIKELKNFKKENYFAVLALPLDFFAALAARSKTLRPLYHPQFMQIVWLLCIALQFSHLENLALSRA
jgi:hypothetical protein